MPISKMPAGQYLGFVAYFNRTQVEGVIGFNEVRAILERAGRDPTSEEVRQIISAVSVNPNGISFQSFIDYVGSFQQLRNVDSEYREAFRIYDRNGTGVLSEDDVAYVFKRLRVAVDVPALFKVADVNKDGSIDYNEFVTLMESQF